MPETWSITSSKYNSLGKTEKGKKRKDILRILEKLQFCVK